MMDEKERFRLSARNHGVGVYGRILRAARDECERLLKQRQQIDRQTKDLQRPMNTILAVCEEDGVELPSDLVLPFDEDVPLSISLIDAVRAVLKVRGDYMTASEVRDDLIAMELDLHKLWNPTAILRKTLKRLLERGEVSGAPGDKPLRFQWIDPAVGPPNFDPFSALTNRRPKNWLRTKLNKRRRAGLLQ
jgi:hypothetical protein